MTAAQLAQGAHVPRGDPRAQRAAEPRLTAAYLTFGDRSVLRCPVSTTSRVTTVAFTPRSVTSQRFTVTQAAPSARDITVSELLVSDHPDPDRNVAQPTSDDVGPAAARSSSAGDGSLAARPEAWVEYTLRQPQEVASCSSSAYRGRRRA